MMNLNFNINTIFLSLIGVFISYTIVGYYLTAVDVYKPPIGNLPVPIQVGKSKVYVSKDRDASMATETKRRRTIIGSNSCAIHPKFGYSGSTNGSLETFFISGLCPTFIKESVQNVCTSIFDGGNADSEYCEILDGNGGDVIVDGGYADTNVCST
jgi:hypothetical protein